MAAYRKRSEWRGKGRERGEREIEERKKEVERRRGR